MRVARPKKLQTKFLLGLAGIALCGGLIFACGLYFHLRSLLEAEVSSKSALLLSQVEAVRTYVRNTLRPKMYEVLPNGEFVIEGMSTSYITRKVMDEMALSGAEPHNYRRVATNARNPRYEANSRERQLIAKFQHDPTLQNYSGFETIAGQEFFVQARPVRFVASCMKCHGVPEDAPKELLDRYGTTRGFGHTLNSIAGVTSVTLPVGSALSRIRGATLGYVSLALAGALFSFAIVNILFNRVVVHNMRRLTDVLASHFFEQADTKVLDELGKGDEIEDVLLGVEQLASHLSTARRKLENYAVNLKKMVDDRTADLSYEAMERNTDVQLFVSLLNALNESHTREDLLRGALPKIGKRFRLQSLTFICTQGMQSYYTWPQRDQAPKLPQNWTGIVAHGQTYISHNCAYIPVRSSNHSIEGYLCLFFEDNSELEPGQVREILTAVGQQLGIALENLTALDTLLTQNAILESIVEGIADPLLLIDEECSVILANSAALALGTNGEGRGAEQVLHRFGLSAKKGETCPLQMMLVKGEPLFYEEEFKDGRSFQISIYPVANSASSDTRAVVYARENTAEKQMLEQMQQNEKLVTVGKMAAGLAHEINNPLGVIACYAELLRSTSTEAQEQADISVILRHTKQAQRVLQDLLNFARPRQTSTGPCHPAEVLRMVGDVFSVQAEAKHSTLELRIPEELPLISASTEALEQILSNLLINALDAIPRDTGRITVTARHNSEKNTVTIITADNGPGIPRKISSHIFDPFFTTKDVGQGTGLGLAVVYGLITDIGGTITVHNDGGAIFTMTFPVAEAETHND
ncbi:c-type heme family protein [Desulfobaculum bizertense]|uniref:histidine kinase n=1 Tax=Desulfobaculum bizertense DSM 18034 TaxID=1121442 RepID=A0A1T4WQT1_9BACT|nr:DUF3365 domain-containing protein [Desulfobaculum bizertense]SKA79732.1 His Kinase A (phospho-acceptor) domain-containing protein [Desulfobaculum bizertense DSM 18034]